MKSLIHNNLKDNKLLGLEIIRFFSALSVLIYHYSLFFYVGGKPVNLIENNLPYYSVISFLYYYGLNFAVTVFWSVSGFIFFYKYSESISEAKIDAMNFFILRLSRLYPLHIITLLIVSVLQFFYYYKNNFYFVYQINDLKNFLLQIILSTTLQRFWSFDDYYSYNGPVWSVSAEILSYFIFFIILRRIGKSLLINILIITLCVFLRVFKLSNSITDCLTFFFLGGSSALLFQSFNSFSYKKIIDAVIFALALFFLILVIFLNLQKNNHFLYIFQFIYIPIVLYLSAINFNLLEKFRNIILVLGNLTYSSYLIHFPIQLLISIICLIFGIKINFYNNVFFLIYIFLVLILSYFTYINFERPIKENIRKNFFKFMNL